ncbi:hypothetical protein JCM10914A_28630 [Paenibacillus sp. JCM 10914]|nr:hypothetical protein JCM10914_4693 [Paenibacillus sp. JCM 10914]
MPSFGIGADEYSFRKEVDQIQLGSMTMTNISLDFSVFHENINSINGLIGLDILKHGGFVISLHQM